MDKYFLEHYAGEHFVLMKPECITRLYTLNWLLPHLFRNILLQYRQNSHVNGSKTIVK